MKLIDRLTDRTCLSLHALMILNKKVGPVFIFLPLEECTHDIHDIHDKTVLDPEWLSMSPITFFKCLRTKYGWQNNKKTLYQLLIVYAILNEMHCSDVDETRIGNVQHSLGNLEKETMTIKYSLIKESEFISSLPTFSYFAEDFMQAEAVVLCFGGPNKRMSITFSYECQKGRSS